MTIVSIIIPVYNVSAYVERCVSSVIRQTYSDIECIIVDDCTPDDSIEKCQRLLDSYSGPIEFKILHHKYNRGLSAARNTGTHAATGEYIYYLDSDDEIPPDCINLLVEEVNMHPGVEMVQGGITTIPKKELFETIPSYVDDNIQIRHMFFKYCSRFPVTAWNKLVKKSFLIDNQITFREGLLHEDYLWIMQLVKRLHAISIIGIPTYLYYQTANSITQTISQQKTARNMMIIAKIAFDELDEPLRDLTLYCHLCTIFHHLEYGYNSKEGIMAMMTSIIVLIRCGRQKLALLCLKQYLFAFTHRGRTSFNIKDNIEIRWEKESINYLHN